MLTTIAVIVQHCIQYNIFFSQEQDKMICILSPAQCCILQPVRPHIPLRMRCQAVHTGSCTREGQWDAWTCPASSGWSRTHLECRHVSFYCMGNDSWALSFYFVFEGKPAMLMEEIKAAARARLSGRVEGVSPPPISARPPTAVRPDRRHSKD